MAAPPTPRCFKKASALSWHVPALQRWLGLVAGSRLPAEERAFHLCHQWHNSHPSSLPPAGHLYGARPSFDRCRGRRPCVSDSRTGSATPESWSKYVKIQPSRSLSLALWSFACASSSVVSSTIFCSCRSGGERYMTCLPASRWPPL